MNIIAITGKKGVGKNFICDIIKEAIEQKLEGDRIEIAAFADPMKEFIVNILGVDRKLIYGNDKDKQTPTQYQWENMPHWLQEKFGVNGGPITIRQSMQIFGTELNREIWDQDIWVKAMLRRIEQAKTKTPQEWTNWFLICDMRYQNEINAIKNIGGKVWKIIGPQRGDEKSLTDSHSSEKVMDSTVNFDYTIANDYSDDRLSLKQKVEEALDIHFDVSHWSRSRETLKMMGKYP